MKQIIISIIIAVVVGAAGFYGGVQYQKSQAGSSANQMYGQSGSTPETAMRLGRRGFGGATIGKIVSEDATSITVQLSDGSSKIVNLSDSTRIMKTDTASKSDLTTGQMVAAFGTTNSDGSVTAQSVQINPMMRGRGVQASGSAQSVQ